MKRATMHRLFSTVAICLLAFVIWHAWKLHENRQIIDAVAQVPARLPADQAIAQDSGVPESKEYPQSAYPEVMLAQANALSAGGQFEVAETAFVKLIDQQQFQPVGQAARFNLANHYLRQGMRRDLPGGQTRPLLEIAKQRYRDLLHDSPLDWDARFNLERALQLAPEVASDERQKGPPVKSVRVIVPDFTLKDLP